jgi:hypothetical protein
MSVSGTSKPKRRMSCAWNGFEKFEPIGAAIYNAGRCNLGPSVQGIEQVAAELARWRISG